MPRVNPSKIIDYWVPAPCGLRIHLRAQNLPEGPADPFLQTLAKLGQQHEDRQRAKLAPYLDLKPGGPEERVARTRKVLQGREHNVIYQPLLLGRATLGGSEKEIIGEPDFLVRHGDGWRVREVKLARNVEGRHHVEITLQVECYGWLLEQTLGQAPEIMEIVLGTGEIHEVRYQGGGEALETLDQLVRFEESSDYGYEPVGWSKCMPCVFRERCWPEARKRNDVSCVPELDQGLARALHDQGVTTVRDLVNRYDEASLAGFSRPWGKKQQKVGKKAGWLLMAATALDTGKDLRLAPLALPEAANYAMFDIEGVPPDLDDDIGRIFLWGLKVYGERPTEFRYAVTGVKSNEDRETWFAFLRLSRKLFDEYGDDLLFVHWAHYEVTKVEAYTEAYGDDAHGTAARVRAALFDLYRVTKNTWALPLPSYGLKVVEGYAGYRRRLSEANGAWAMAKFIEAVELEEESEREAQVGEILKYNEEDLDATWQILKWLMIKEDREVPGGSGP
jgi:predicted RecB family nuclease